MFNRAHIGYFCHGPALPTSGAFRQLVQPMQRVAVAGGTMQTRAAVGSGCRITIRLPRSLGSRS